MPREHKSRREVIDAIRTIPSLSDLLSMHDGNFDYELDLEVVVYGRNYNGKKVGPYVRLLSYEPSEAIVIEGDWGGNSFYVIVTGFADVFVRTPEDTDVKVAELKPGTSFGEMSVLGGVPRNATVKAPPDKTIQVMEVQRPALRLLRKLPKFGENLDKTYRAHGKNSSLEDIKGIAGLSADHIAAIREMSLFRVFSKSHILFGESTVIDRLYIIKEGWLHRTHNATGSRTEDYLGHGYCFGIDGIVKNAVWPYSVTLMGRTEVLEISIARLRENVALREALLRELSRFAPPVIAGAVDYKPAVREKMLSSQQELIETGLVDANNLLVMDMDLCVRCGNCSLACHNIHGQSRLTRRGIHVTRLESPRPRAIQSVLSPEVCMHCKDPECLTGCPTGAIGRFGAGQIDIDPKTCIGCGDCATQCPYNAISMISRKGQPTNGKGGLGWRLQDMFRLQPDPLPPPVEATEDLLAVKCNLCNGTSINPAGSRKQAYSCEENCPTGALARINPRAYFTEIGTIEGLLMIDQTHATGRNIHKSDPPKRAIHSLGILLTVVLTAAAIIGLERFGLGEQLWGFLNMRWITGLVGLVGIAAVMTYPFRRQIYRRRAGPLRYWMLAHSYLGVIAGIMILLHGGTDSGGALTTALMWSFDLVIFTGLLGIFCYLVVPRLLTKIEGVPLLIDDLKTRREELQKELAMIAGAPSEKLRQLVKNKVAPRFFSFGYLLRQYFRWESLDAALAKARYRFEPVAAELEGDDDRRNLLQAVETAATLRRIDALIYLHYALKLWLPPHVASTSLMLALMIVHIIQVIYYAAR